MANIFIIHGIYGHPEENWFPWLKAELEKLGHTVWVPQLPNPENPTLEEWTRAFARYQEFFTPSTIVVGHSLGVPFLLSVIERNEVRAAFFVAGFASKVNNQFDEAMKTFTQTTFNWERIRRNGKNFYIFHSDNDPYVRIEKAQELASHLGVEVSLIEGASHFNTAAGYTKFEALLDAIQPFL